MASADRPTALVVPTSGRTSAVEESASAKPSAMDPLPLWPNRWSAPPISTAETISSAAQTPKTSRRIVHNRGKLSSSPIEKSRRMIPNSANGAIASGFEIVR